MLVEVQTNDNERKFLYNKCIKSPDRIQLDFADKFLDEYNIPY